MTKAKYGILFQKIELEIADAHRRRRKNRRLAGIIRVTVLASTGAIPVLLGFRGSSANAEALANIALVLGALATAVSAWESFYRPRDLWASNTAAYVQLKDLKTALEFETSSGEDVTDAALDKAHAQLRRIISEANTAWVGVRQATAMQASAQAAVPAKDS